MDPTDTGGVPQVMPSNNWWEDIGSQIVTAATDIATVRAAPSGNIASATPNPPPGGGGVNPQAAATPGGLPASLRVGALNLSSLTSTVPGLIMLAVGAFVLLKVLRKI
jgi:hypothetical protein